ncbi:MULTISPECIES: histidine kinase dimerization/phosphoacceptor domain -containing protein [Rhizobium/Agrobacterium group]|uniref:sensor histidine kinase n=1 Tax=Rhizobium/Agrobacterium group TaxID=227290 RepID=UPI0007134857|nr:MULTISPECIES: histidine kinase dimerization/phosphoacceptor domain -containing protein [Rhizobium/Agrobacterium group]KQQ49404.1 histidine kinase [Rhizobium sp. Leaf311]
MNDISKDQPSPANIADLPNLAAALDDDRFRQFLDHVPFAVAVAEFGDSEQIVYGNLEFERLTALPSEQLQGQPWSVLPVGTPLADGPELAAALLENEEYLGAFTIQTDEATLVVDAWSNTIVDESEEPLFRLLAMSSRERSDVTAALSESLAEKDVLLKELQHRVKNNLQMITALIRMEARNAQGKEESIQFGRLAGRIDALSILYRSLYSGQETETVDLGIYVSQIASSVMAAHAVEGIRLDLKIDTWPVSVNVAMPVGLVINELMTNALKHAFVGRDSGLIAVRCVVDDTGCKILVTDDGIGLAEASDWPRRGKLSAMIVESVKRNANAEITVESEPGKGMTVTISFKRSDAVDE